MSKLFSCHYERYGEMSARSTEKMIDFDFRQEYLKGVDLINGNMIPKEWKGNFRMSER